MAGIVSVSKAQVPLKGSTHIIPAQDEVLFHPLNMSKTKIHQSGKLIVHHPKTQGWSAEKEFML